MAKHAKKTLGVVMRVILMLAKEFNLLTASGTNKAVTRGIDEDPERASEAQLILTWGPPQDNKECRECRRMLPPELFRWYEGRSDRHGYLQGVNRVCIECQQELEEERQRALNSGTAIPPRPAPGDKCPTCERNWPGNWHRHHDGNEFIRWECGLCNMKRHDQRDGHLRLTGGNDE